MGGHQRLRYIAGSQRTFSLFRYSLYIAGGIHCCGAKRFVDWMVSIAAAEKIEECENCRSSSSSRGCLGLDSASGSCSRARSTYPFHPLSRLRNTDATVAIEAYAGQWEEAATCHYTKTQVPPAITTFSARIIHATYAPPCLLPFSAHCCHQLGFVFLTCNSIVF